MNAIFHGTEVEARELLEAVRRSCTCSLQSNGQPDGSCSAHHMLLDQRALDGLLFVRRERLAHMLDREHHPCVEFGTTDQKGDAEC
jgi:hypothetical protein